LVSWVFIWYTLCSSDMCRCFVVDLLML
jgi:hypothetical protein